MHLSNILSQLNANSDEQDSVRHHFASQKVSYSAVENFIHNLRKNK
jgi:hypothetical protein